MDVYLFNPKNQAFLEDRSKHLDDPTRRPRYWLGIIAFTLFGGLVPQLYVKDLWRDIQRTMNGGSLDLSNLLIVALVVGMWGWWVILLFVSLNTARLRLRRLEREGVIVPGEVKTVSAAGSKWQVVYYYTSPGSLSELQDIIAVQPSQRNAAMPESGTPLAVLYIDEQLHQLL